MDRRQFLAAAAGVVAAPAVPEPLPVVDTHQHLWDLGTFRLPWIKDDSKLKRNFLMSDYLQATAGLHVVKTVYMEVDVAPEQHTAEAEYVLGLCRRADNPMVAAVIGGRPAADGFAAHLDQFRGSAYVKGVRQVLHGPSTPPGYCLDPAFLKGVRLLGDRGLMFDVCVRPGELTDAAKLIDACPGTQFILDHCGNADVKQKDLSAWKKDIAEVARRRNVVCKVSGIVAGAVPGRWTADDLAPAVRHTLAVFGPDRVMFGGDWPVCTLAATFKQWLEALALLVADRPDAERRRLFHDNAVRVYRLP